MRVELIGLTRYLRGLGTCEELLTHAGRMCYRSKAIGGEGEFLSARVREGHESLIEHASASFEISGISRACSHQLVRHRLASISQESQRYVEMDTVEWVMPDSILENIEANEWFFQAMHDASEAYHMLRKSGIAKEDARFVLPNAALTRMVFTANFRELLHIFRLRISPQAQWEIRGVTKEMLKLVYPQAPSVFGDEYSRVFGV